jgi:hypothetical protein
MPDLSNPLVFDSVLREQDSTFFSKAQYLAPAMVASTLASVGNSANWTVQKLGGEGWEEANASEMLSSFSQNAAEYYQDNSKAVDTLAAIGVSLATFNPVASFRTAASGLRFATPEMAGMGLATRGVGYAFGAGDALETWALTRAAASVKAGTTSPFWRGIASPGEFFAANGNGLAMAAGKGYSFAVEAAASELLTFSLMHQSSAYEGVTDWSSLRNHLTNTALFGGGIGVAAGIFGRNITKFKDGGADTTIANLVEQQEQTINLANLFASGAPDVATFATKGDNLTALLRTYVPDSYVSSVRAAAPQGFANLGEAVFQSLNKSHKGAIQEALVGTDGLMQGFGKLEGTEAVTRKVFDSLLTLNGDEQLRLMMAADSISPVTGRSSGRGSVIFNPTTKEMRYLNAVEEGAERTQLFRAADRAGGNIVTNAGGIKLGDQDFLKFIDFNKVAPQDLIVKAVAQDAEAVWVQGHFQAQNYPMKGLDVAEVPAPILEGMLRQNLLAQGGDKIVATQVLYSAKLEAIAALEAKGADLQEIAFRTNSTEEFVKTKDIKQLLDAPSPVSAENVQVNYANKFDSIDEWALRGNAEWNQRLAAEQNRIDALLMPVFGGIDLPRINISDIGNLGGDSADVFTALNAKWGSTLETLSYAGQQMFTLRNRRAAEIEAELFHPAKALRQNPEHLFAANVLRTEQLRVPSAVGTVVDTASGTVRTGAGYKIEELANKVEALRAEFDTLINPRTGRARKGNGKRAREIKSMINGAEVEQSILRGHLEDYLANGGKDVLFSKPAVSAKDLATQIETLKPGGVAAEKDAAKVAQLEKELVKAQRDEAVWNFTTAYARAATRINPIRQAVYTAKNQPFKTWADPILAEFDGMAMDLHFRQQISRTAPSLVS